jgi:hypothetical protein
MQHEMLAIGRSGSSCDIAGCLRGVRFTSNRYQIDARDKRRFGPTANREQIAVPH